MKRKQPAGRLRKKSLNVKRTIVIAGHKTSATLEDAFWNALKEIVKSKNDPLSDVVSTINRKRRHTNLSSAIRLFVLDHYRRLAELKRKEE